MLQWASWGQPGGEWWVLMSERGSGHFGKWEEFKGRQGLGGKKWVENQLVGNLVTESNHVDASCLIVSDVGRLSSTGLDFEDRVAEREVPTIKLSLWWLELAVTASELVVLIFFSVLSHLLSHSSSSSPSLARIHFFFLLHNKKVICMSSKVNGHECQLQHRMLLHLIHCKNCGNSRMTGRITLKTTFSKHFLPNVSEKMTKVSKMLLSRNVKQSEKVLDLDPNPDHQQN